MSILLTLIFLYIIGYCCTRYWMDIFIFLPTKLGDLYRFSFSFPFEEFMLDRPNGAKINGIWGKSKQSKGLILYFHGNADNLVRWGKVAEDFVRMDWDVMMIDYRGYGKSRGKKTEIGMYGDAMAAYDFALRHFSVDKIVIYGRSIGSAFAIFTASEVQPPLLILETPFFSMPALFDSYYPFLPKWFRFKFNFRSDQYIQSIKCPIWLFHGTWDTVVPYSHALKFKQLLKEKIHLVTIETARHKDCPEFREYRLGMEAALATIVQEQIS